MIKLWSHQVAQSLVTETSPEGTDARYALSHRYGDGVVLVLPLPSGNFAIFGNNRQLLARVSEEDLTSALIKRVSEAGLAESQARASARAKASSTKILIIDKSPEDFGI